MSKTIKIDAISDLHGNYPVMPGGDILILAGDYTATGTDVEWHEFFFWVGGVDYTHIVIISGNHDNFPADSCWDMTNVYYLEDSEIEIDGISIYGTPWTKTFDGMNPRCKHYTKDTEEELQKKWDLIPKNVDILVSHGPMLHILDQNREGYACGSHTLRTTVEKKNPAIMIFGHIHEQGGNQLLLKSREYGTVCANVSHVDENYDPTHDCATFWCKNGVFTQDGLHPMSVRNGGSEGL